MEQITYVTLPPIPPELQISSEFNPFGLPRYLGKVTMLDANDWRSGHWGTKIGQLTANTAAPPPHGLNNAGFYTVGIDTCVGLAMSFCNSAGTQRHICLAHLTNIVVLHEAGAVAAIVGKMLTDGRAIGPEQRVVIGFDESNPDKPAISQALLAVLSAQGVANATITQFEDTDGATRQAVDAAMEIGSWTR